MNYWRRAFGVLLCLAPCWLLLLSLGWAACGHVMPRKSMGIGAGLMGGAILLGSLNCYLWFIRPTLFQHKPDYRYISGIPVIGTLLVIAGVVVAFGGVQSGILGMIAVLLDTGGLPWFLVATWRDASLWDTP